MTSRIGQLCGVDEVADALARDVPVHLLLVAQDDQSADVAELLDVAKSRGIPVRSVSARVIERLSRLRPAAPVLGLFGRDPRAGLDEMIAARGAIWLLVGVAYPGNVGMVIRTAEVSGAEGIVVDASFDSEGRKAALRAAMRADKFMPVRWEAADPLLERARAAGHRVLALDENGARAHFDTDLCGPRVFVVGGENGGIPAAVLARCDERIHVPMAGFIPCYNLQAAVSAIATERLRQLAR